MAKKEDKKEAKVVLERTYNIPLRKEYLKAPRWKRTKKAVKAVGDFIKKHMKSENVKIGKYLNLKLWEHGIRNPPHHIKVIAKKDEEGKVLVEIVGAPKEKPKEVKPAKKPEEAKGTITGIEGKVDDGKDEKAEKAKEIQKEELKELKKELPKMKQPKPAAMPKQSVPQRPTAPQQK